MNTFIVSGSFICFFLSLYLSFDYWYKKIWLRVLMIRDETQDLYEDFFVRKDEKKVLNELMMIGGFNASLVFFILWPNVIFALIMSAIVFWHSLKLPRFYLLKIKKASRVKKFSNQMVDALTLMGNGLKSGLNIAQTIQIVVDEMPEPISQEFGLVLNENKVGLTLEKAFDNLAKRIPSEDVNMFVTSVNILRETGGNLAETFATIVLVIRERLKLQEKIKAMTAQGMTSAVIVCSLPWVIAVMMYSIDPVMMRPLFTTIPGYAVMLLVLILEIFGFFVIMKIVKVKV